MTDDRRRQLRQDYRQHPPAAGVYRIVNQRTGRQLLGWSMNLPSVRAKLDFARATNTPSALDRRLWQDFREYGPEALTFEVLEEVEVKPEMTSTQVQADLEVLESLWRERLNELPLY